MQVVTRYLWGGIQRAGGSTQGTAKIFIDDGVGGSSTSCSHANNTWGNTGVVTSSDGLPFPWISKLGTMASEFSDCYDSGVSSNLELGGTSTVRGQSFTQNDGDSKWYQANSQHFKHCNQFSGGSSPSGEDGATVLDGNGNWPWAGGSPGDCYSWQQWNMVSGTILAYTLTDAIIDHDVDILGFELEDIKIPREIDKQNSRF